MTEIEDTGPLRIHSGDTPVVADRPMDHKAQPKKKDKGPIPARQANGYYADHATGDRLRSVTTILSGGVPKPALMFWAASVCTESAIENLPGLVNASRDPQQLQEMRDYIKRAHTRKKDERAEVGSAVHLIIESRILGTPMPASVTIGDAEWGMDGPELRPFVENFVAFEKAWRPQWTASEMVVANAEHGYAGTLDYTIAGTGLIGEMLRGRGYEVPRGVDLMGDTKTGGEWDRITSGGHVHGVYPEAGLQMSAYRRAKVAWIRDGSRVDMPATAEVGVVLHLRPEGYRLYPVRCGDLEYSYFRHAQMVDEWSSRIASAKADEPVVGAALELPSADKAVA
jgi:hypothetical protein